MLSELHLEERIQTPWHLLGINQQLRTAAAAATEGKL